MSTCLNVREQGSQELLFSKTDGSWTRSAVLRVSARRCLALAKHTEFPSSAALSRWDLLDPNEHVSRSVLCMEHH